MELIVFPLGPDLFGLPIEHVSAVLPPSAIRPVPLAPTHIRGITAHEGDVLTVVDAGLVLRRVAASAGPSSRMLLLNGTAWLVDGEPEAVTCESSGTRIVGSEFLAGVVQTVIGQVALIDCAALARV
ncbi:MAG: chemotaxis protein CheW [Firmicutes bacterium]|nr:chemotaxis protein CheW [Bacillota bacterium]